MNHDQLFWFQLVELQRRHDRATGEIHEGLGFQQHQSLSLALPLRGESAELLTGNRQSFQMGKPVQKQKTRVMAGPLILGAWIAQTCDEKRLHEMRT